MIPVIDTILSIVGKFIPDQNAQMELRKALSDNEVKIEESFVKYAQLEHDLRMKELENTGFKAMWRPLVMALWSGCLILYLFMYYILPQIIVVFNINTYFLPPVEMPEIVWEVFAFCIIGIAGFRTIDKWKKS